MPSSTPNKFVKDLLKKSASERLEGFRAFTVKHPLLTDAYDESLCAIRDSSPGSIILIYGSPGVGKTTLLERLEKHLIEKMLSKLAGDPERLAVVKVLAAAPTHGNFDWKEFFKHLLIAMEEPLADYKIDREKWRSPYSNTASNITDIPGMRPLRAAVEQTLKYRRPLAVLIDEAQHFGVISSGRKLLDQLNAIKSLADRSKRTHVLCGTYELLPFRNLNGQLSRRSLNVHFGRYHVENEEHRKAFINVLYTFQEHLPFIEPPDLIARWDYFYERSIGCVGVLKDWLMRALSLALNADSSTLPIKTIEQRALSVSQCASMLREAITGEKELEEREESRLLLRRSLGLEGFSPVEKQENLTSSSSMSTPAITAKRRRRSVGARNPVRDEIGENVK